MELFAAEPNAPNTDGLGVSLFAGVETAGVPAPDPKTKLGLDQTLLAVLPLLTDDVVAEGAVAGCEGVGLIAADPKTNGFGLVAAPELLLLDATLPNTGAVGLF